MTTEERNRAIRNTIDAISARLRPEDTGISSRVGTNYVGADISEAEAAEFLDALDGVAEVADFNDNDNDTTHIRVRPDISIDPVNRSVDASGLWRDFNAMGKSYIRQLTSLDSKPLMLNLIKKAINKGLITSKDILMLFNEVKHDDS